MAASNPDPNRRPVHNPARQEIPGSGSQPGARPIAPPRPTPRWLNWRFAAYGIAVAVALLLAGTISPRRLVSYQSLPPLLAFIVLAGVANAVLTPLLARLGVGSGCLWFGLAAVLMNAVLATIAARLSVGMAFSVWGVVTAAALLSVASGFVFSLVDERNTEKAGYHAER